MDMVSLCSLGCPGTHPVDQAGLELKRTTCLYLLTAGIKDVHYHTEHVFLCDKKIVFWGWGFSSVVERLPRKRKALGSVPSSEKKNQKKKIVFF